MYNKIMYRSTLHVPVLVGAHLRKPQHRVLALQTVVVRLLAAVLAVLHPAVLAGRELLEPGRLDRVELLVLPPVRHHLVGVGAHEVALETVEVGRLVLRVAQVGGVGAVRPAAGHVGAVLLEVAAHQRVEALVSGRVLHESGLVAEAVAAVLSLTVEVGLVLPVAAVLVVAVLVEPEPQIALGYWLVFEDSHGVLHSGLLGFRGHFVVG